jgi:hypothetical protein
MPPKARGQGLGGLKQPHGNEWYAPWRRGIALDHFPPQIIHASVAKWKSNQPFFSFLSLIPWHQKKVKYDQEVKYDLFYGRA